MRICRAYTLESSHQLTGVPPTHKCSRLHGHQYRVVLTIEGPVDPVSGFVIDFWELDRAFAPLHEQLDHHHLNDVPGLGNPTAELIATWIGERLAIPGLRRVTVYETPDCWAEWDSPA
ncbi:6-carboxy-5,6,7,8-tetrahydropterin synthase [Rhodovastum atsumiense]|uniref:6-carboxy-5,6,7,8-tetrahydropterin synthase n=1 Tax=Rhodovastum atsumiense TaxID=504468 RepID=A0A5M6IVE1_9PROT|nr:6-carboxytetrahydropterin synthase [Rhodovastum atsumiense]KAA5612274.1 6-carboxytetrahydropterin synthase [Rhodovastum atsumiense]CAH2601600.1 6-carboxy-5,6,7,8-tetrahydropterin synthase [Rhodovastum atsumiense]